MKLLVYSPAFLPRIGGLELNVAHFAAEMVELGCAVVVVTQTAGRGADDLPYRVVRRPSPWELLRLTRWCDLFYQANVSLRGLWPLLLVRRPWVVSHHSWYDRGDGRVAWQDHLKRFLLHFADSSISVSQAIADDLTLPSLVIPNSYRDQLFRVLPDALRSQDLVFLGRLVSDKGVDVLLEALKHLADRGLRPNLSIIGEGPERQRLGEQAERLGVLPQIEFLGTRTGEELVRLLNRHRILVVPSRYHEPFGIVALEGIACGCAVVGSAGGGLPEAIGPCGRTFRNGDARELAAILEELLAHPEERAALLATAAGHLAEHGSRRISTLYFRELSRALASRLRGAARGKA